MTESCSKQLALSGLPPPLTLLIFFYHKPCASLLNMCQENIALTNVAVLPKQMQQQQEMALFLCMKRQAHTLVFLVNSRPNSRLVLLTWFA